MPTKYVKFGSIGAQQAGEVLSQVTIYFYKHHELMDIVFKFLKIRNIPFPGHLLCFARFPRCNLGFRCAVRPAERVIRRLR